MDKKIEELLEAADHVIEELANMHQSVPNNAFRHQKQIYISQVRNVLVDAVNNVRGE